MPFDLKLIEAKLALSLISSKDMPSMACDALEAGLDGPAVVRLAILESPTGFEVDEVLPLAMQEMGLNRIPVEEAAARLALQMARKILRSGDDPLEHIRDFESICSRGNYPKELTELGSLYDNTYIWEVTGHSEAEIRERVHSVLSDFVQSREKQK